MPLRLGLFLYLFISLLNEVYGSVLPDAGGQKCSRFRDIAACCLWLRGPPQATFIGVLVDPSSDDFDANLMKDNVELHFGQWQTGSVSVEHPYSY